MGREQRVVGGRERYSVHNLIKIRFSEIFGIEVPKTVGIDSTLGGLERHAKPASASQEINSADAYESFAQRNDGPEKHPETHGLIPRYEELTTDAQTRFIDMMRLIPHGLVIVFASEHHNLQTTFPWQGNMGMLVSSFNSVAVDPTPFVSFNVKVPSQTFDEIRRTSFFTVVAVSNAKVADAFTGHSKDRQIIFDNLMSSKGPEAASQGLIWWMGCQLVHNKCITVGDHVIVVGQVIRSGAFKGTQDQEALVYSRCSYRLLGVQVTPEDDARRIKGLLWSSKLPKGNDQESLLGSDVESKNEAFDNFMKNFETGTSKDEKDTKELQETTAIKDERQALESKSASFPTSGKVLSQKLFNSSVQKHSLGSDVESENKLFRRVASQTVGSDVESENKLFRRVASGHSEEK